jgi:hypothetical protein
LKLSIFTQSLLFTLLVFSQNLSADGLSELQEALAKLNGNDPLSATVESAYTEKRGKKKKQKTKTGLIQVELSDDQHGLKLIYSNKTINNLELEATDKENNEDADTPTLNAVRGVGVSEMKNMLSSAANLLRRLNKATFVDEKEVIFQDKQVRQLSFTLPLEAIIENKEVHEYVDDFKGSYQILINGDGIPLESTTSFTGSGSAYIFFSMDITQSSQSTFQLKDNRLITVKRTYQNKQSSTWGDTESEGYKILIIQPDSYSIAATL